jgi:hypothetical protein
MWRVPVLKHGEHTSMGTSMSVKISSFSHPSTRISGRIDQLSVGPKVCQRIDPR